MITADSFAVMLSIVFVYVCPWAAAAISSSRSGYQGEPSGLGYQGELLGLGYQGASVGLGYQGELLGLGYQGATVGLGYQEEEDVMISLAAENTPTIPFH